MFYDTKYYSRVTTDLTAGGWGPVRSFTTGNPVSQAYVTSPGNNAVNTNTTLNVSSNTVPEASEYTIQLSEVPDFSTIDFEVTGPSRTLAFNGLKFNTKYYNRVRTDLDPTFGTVRSFTTADPLTLAYITSPGNTAINVNTVLNISSNTVGSATQYTIQLSESPDFATIHFEITGPTRTLAFSGLKYNTTYYNRVITDVTSEFGQVRSFTTRTPESIAYVTSPGNNAVDRNTTLNVSSNTVPGAALYTIQLSESSDFATVDFERSGATRTLSFSGLKYNTTYYNRVLTDLTTNFGLVRSFTTRTAESLAYVTSPSNGAVDRNTTLNITSNTVPGAASYTIQLSTLSDFSVIAYEMTGTTRTMNFSGLNNGTTYYNRVRTDLSSAFGYIRSFTTIGNPPGGRLASSAEVEEQPFELKEFDVQAYPNPFREKLTLYVESSLYDQAEITMLDLNGRLVHQSVEQTNSVIEIEKPLIAGVYIVETKSGNKVHRLKVIKTE